MQRTIVFRALPLKRDARTSRYKDHIEGDVIFDTWEDSFSLSRGISRLKIGRKKMPLLISYPFYLLYLFIFSLFRLRNNDRVICMELDTFLPILLGTFWRNNIVYLDIVDPISQTKFRKFLFNTIFDYIEYYILLKYKYNIIPNLNRIQYYKDRLGKPIESCNFLLVENVPKIVGKPVLKQESYDIGYFGTLDESRGLKELIKYSIKENLTLLIAGMGPLENYIKKKMFEVGKKRLNFIGKFSPNYIEDLYASVRFSWAFYDDQTLLHKYASPNKYYEHLALKTPLIINRFVPISKIIGENPSGIIIEDDLNSKTFERLAVLIADFNEQLCDFSAWDRRYKKYEINFLDYERTNKQY